MRLVDTHVHLNMSHFERDREEVISRAREAGVEVMVEIGADIPSSRRAVRMARSYEGIFAAVGVHPHDAGGLEDGHLFELTALASEGENDVVAIGESGLDFHYDNSPRSAQRGAFREQIRLARELELPLVVHSRDAEEDTLKILREEKLGPGVLMHCFSGGREMAEGCLELGCYIAVGGVLTFNSASGLRALAGEIIPQERLVLETDAPYLAPEPHRGRRNEPAYVRAVAARLAEIWNMDTAEVAGLTANNALRFFGLEALGSDWRAWGRGISAGGVEKGE